jgi:hypothetical protein
VKNIVPKLTIFAGLLAIILCFGIPVSPASAYGNEKWCLVTDQGGDNIVWDCEYETADDCAPAITAGSRGFCALNPSWRPNPNPSTQH